MTVLNIELSAFSGQLSAKDKIPTEHASQSNPQSFSPLRVRGGAGGGVSLIFWLLILLLNLAYALPWLMNPGVTLSPNAWDLGEWTSLNPSVHAETPILLTSLLLRLPLLCIGLIVAFHAEGRFQTASWWLHAIFVLATAVALLPALLPPLDLIQSAAGDVNYGQMFNLAVAALVVGLIGLSGILGRWRRWFIAGIALLAGVSGIWGMLRGYALMQQFNLPVAIGAGGVLLALACLLVAIYETR